MKCYYSILAVGKPICFIKKTEAWLIRCQVAVGIIPVIITDMANEWIILETEYMEVLKYI